MFASATFPYSSSYFCDAANLKVLPSVQQCWSDFWSHTDAFYICIIPADQQSPKALHCVTCRMDQGGLQQGSMQEPLLHLARVTASQPCSLLTLSALDLARFGPDLIADMQQYASSRREWRHQRLTACRDAVQVCDIASVPSASHGSC